MSFYAALKENFAAQIEQKKREQRNRAYLQDPARMRERLAEYDAYTSGQHEKLLQGFRQYAETGAGRALGGILRQQELGAARRGIQFSGLAARGAAGAQAQLYGQAQEMQGAFASRLGMLAQQNRDAFLRGEFGFMNEIAKLELSYQFQRDLLKLQAKLQKDAESRNAFYSLAGSIGGYIAGGPVGSAVGSWLGGGTQDATV